MTVMDLAPPPPPRPAEHDESGPLFGRARQLDRIEDKLDWLITGHRKTDGVLTEFAGVLKKYGHLLPGAGKGVLGRFRS